MKLKRLTLENFRGQKNLGIDLGARLTLLMGANGSGKTTILDGIAIGLGEVASHLPQVAGVSFKKTGEIYQKRNKTEPYARVTLQTTQGLTWDRLTRRDQSSNTLRQIPQGHGARALKKLLDETVIDPLNAGARFELPVFAYYGVSRALLDVPLTRKGFTKQHVRLEALTNALNADSRFKSAFVWFYNKENEEHRLQKARKSFDVTLRELDCVRQAIQRVFPDLSEPHIELNPLRFVVNQQGEWFNITQLSDGYKTLLGLVIDLSARMAMANPHLEDPLAAEAIVMIDELDLHLHPQWQQRIAGDLLRAFPDTQFIVSTHSPYVVEAINNHLKRNAIDHLQIEDDAIRQLLPLSAADIEAYFLGVEGEQPLLDRELGLLDDRLLENFNAINVLYERMRDIEWLNKSE
ncbi:AAA family ATPase [Aromatoleum aromaticum]|uniref:AAA family ATPase n=1 Tax=Aromatoleum aromaticum TaxID=551760 RepID=UPI00145968E8|nr:AAA family ATPase [Aromatoleum aromaticum]NMG55447.1 AAA family ATPase [Aromatoleum aromaticum]